MFMAEAFAKAGITSEDFQDVEVPEYTEEQYEADQWIHILETYLKMDERNASEKERHNFVVRHGFLSLNHFNLYLTVSDDVGTLEYELEHNRDFLSPEKVQEMEEKIAFKKSELKKMRDKDYYKIMMRILGQEDYSPYGKDLLKRTSSETFTHVWSF